MSCKNIEPYATVNYDALWSWSWTDMQRYGPVHKHQRRINNKLLSNLTFSSVIDVGCGEGSNLLNITHNFHPNVVCGIDISEMAIQKAKTGIPNGCFFVLDIQKERLEEKFDLVTCFDVIEHLEHDRDALRNMSDMCNKYLLISTITGNMRECEIDIGHHRNYKKSGLIEMISASQPSSISGFWTGAKTIATNSRAYYKGD